MKEPNWRLNSKFLLDINCELSKQLAVSQSPISFLKKQLGLLLIQFGGVRTIYPNQNTQCAQMPNSKKSDSIMPNDKLPYL